MNILVIRFRQMGDAILSTVLLNTLRASFPDARIDFVLNQKLEALFQGHPAISHIIPFTDQERHAALKYVRKVWRTVHQTRYDVIIDLRSTANTMLFALFSPRTRYRIGLKKGYTRLAFNHQIVPCSADESMVDHNLKMLSPLEALGPLRRVREFTLSLTPQEQDAFRQYMASEGIDFSRPVMLAGVATRVPEKSWSEEHMTWVLRQALEHYPQLQIVLNYAPGAEEACARRIYQALGSPRQIPIALQARSQRQLVAMAACCSCYFGNEGGARHIVQAVGRPSQVICAPTSSRKTWIPQNSIPAEAIDPRDMADAEAFAAMSYDEQFRLVQKEQVWSTLQHFLNKYVMA